MEFILVLQPRKRRGFEINKRGIILNREKKMMTKSHNDFLTAFAHIRKS